MKCILYSNGHNLHAFIIESSFIEEEGPGSSSDNNLASET
jgi:hypothetical protein